jgi:hypothetical protein
MTSKRLDTFELERNGMSGDEKTTGEVRRYTGKVGRNREEVRRISINLSRQLMGREPTEEEIRELDEELDDWFRDETRKV